VSRRISTQAAWALCVPVNLVLALLAYWPLAMLFLLSYAVAGELGWATSDPGLTDDGFTPMIFFVVVLWLVFLPIMIGLNSLVVRRAPDLPRAYWLVSALLIVLPNVLVISA
jgi:uncharacterized membrane protein YhaH (DUF805 family)